jgi:hypothetical protein
MCIYLQIQPKCFDRYRTKEIALMTLKYFILNFSCFGCFEQCDLSKRFIIRIFIVR